MNSYVAIILGVSVIILIYVIYLVLFKSSCDTILNSPIDLMGSDKQVKGTLINPDLIKNITSSNYAISCWVCVNNWNTTMSNGKTIYGLLIDKSTQSFTPDARFSNKQYPDKSTGNTDKYPIFPWHDISSTYPILFTPHNQCYYSLCLDSKYPNLYFTINAKAQTVPASGSNDYYSFPIFITDNFPMQKWTNVVISMEGNQLDAYIDGKLIQSGPIAYLDSSGNSIFLIKKEIAKKSTNPGFIIGNNKDTNVDISVTNVSIYSNAIDPQTANSIYRYGSGVSSNRTKVHYLKTTIFTVILN